MNRLCLKSTGRAEFPSGHARGCKLTCGAPLVGLAAGAEELVFQLGVTHLGNRPPPGRSSRRLCSPSFIIITAWANSEPGATGPARNERRETNTHSHTPLCLWRLEISLILFLMSSTGSSTHIYIPTLPTFGTHILFQHGAAVGNCLGRDLAPFASFHYSITLSFRLHQHNTDYRLHSIFH
jgi:hypothetical protein